MVLSTLVARELNLSLKVLLCLESLKTPAGLQGGPKLSKETRADSFQSFHSFIEHDFIRVYFVPGTVQKGESNTDLPSKTIA